MTLKNFNITTLFILLFFTFNIAIADTLKDTAITAAVKLKLTKESDIPAKDIKVETKDEIVTLSGELPTELQATHAIELIASIDNVKDVIATDLKVKDSKAPLADALITAKAKGRIINLFINKKIAEGYDLHVETTDQKVHILGTVTLENDSETVKNAISSISGVKSVETNIKVKAK
ncbi:MAG: BON domain-containing protein [Candidatus Rickettsia vulgarisii]